MFLSLLVDVETPGNFGYFIEIIDIQMPVFVEGTVSGGKM